VIRKSLAYDTGSVFRIWKTCFGDDDEYIHFFLEKLYLPDHCLLAVIDGEPVAMLHLLPINYHDGVKQSRAQYIYAAATLPKYRRRGIMAELIDEALLQGEQNGSAFTALLPANEGLYDYYEKSGFHTAFHIKRMQLSRKEIETLSEGDGYLKQTKPDTELMLRQRQSFLKPAVLWGRELFDYIVAEWRFTGGKIISWENGYCFYRCTADAVFIKEACMASSDRAGIAKELLKIRSSDKFIFQLAEKSNLFTGDAFMRYGMIKMSNGAAVTDLRGGTYFNMMLD
jgi:predicted acetyltransferase